MNKKRYYKILFLSGAVWNLAVGTIFMVITIVAFNFGITLFNMTPPDSKVFIQGFLILVFAIGIGLLAVSFNPQQYYWMIFMFAFEKYAINIVVFVHYFMGEFNFLFVAMILVDLVYGILFTEFLIRYRKK
ncbi:MAG: hypothetical protein JW776_14535 [Candidatus Lokiarchaeota archaeon]|nr:hypothetical protein [Candidatus Lokiarchaeota archaeon]